MKYLFLACILFSLNALAEVPIQPLGSFNTVQSSDGEHCHGYNIDLWRKSDTEIFGLLSHHAGLCGDPACSVVTGSNQNGYLNFSTTQPIYDKKYSFNGLINKNKQLVGQLNNVDLALKSESDTLEMKAEKLTQWCSFWEQVPRCQGVREYCASISAKAKPNNVGTPLKQAMVIVTEGQFFDTKYNNGVSEKYWAQHLGTDFQAKASTPVYATKSGEIKEIINSDNPFNAAVIIESIDVSRQVYGHLKPDVKIFVGKTIEQGDLIGYVRDSNSAYGYSAHLHYGENTKGNVGTGKNLSGWGWGRAPYKTTCDKAVEAGWVDVVKLYGWGNTDGSKASNNCYMANAISISKTHNVKTLNWVHTERPDLQLKLGESKDNFKFSKTGEVVFGGNVVFPKTKRIDAYTVLKVYISPSNPSKALVAFRDWDHGVLRAAIVDLNNKTIISNQLIPESSVRGVGRVNILTISDTAFSWSPDGQFVAMAISPGEFQLNLAVVNLYSGKINQHWPSKLSELKEEEEAYSPDMQSIKWIRNKSLQFNFDHYIYKDNEGHVKDYSATETIASTDLPSNFKINQGGGSKGKTLSPPKTYQHWGACPFECCVYREWIGMEPIMLYQTRDERSKVVANLIKNENVLAMTGVVITQKVGRAKILLPIKAWENSKSTSPNEVTINKGEIIYPLHYEGEGYSAFWYNGKVYSAELINTKQVNIEQEYQYDWWAQIKTKNGKIGWTKQTNIFANQDTCG